MMSITTEAEMTYELFTLMCRTNSTTVQMASDLLQLGRDPNVTVSMTEATSGHFKWVRHLSKANPKPEDVKEYIEEKLEGIQELMEESGFKHMFRIKRCIINHDGDIYNYRIDKESGEWVEY